WVQLEEYRPQRFNRPRPCRAVHRRECRTNREGRLRKVSTGIRARRCVTLRLPVSLSTCTNKFNRISELHSHSPAPETEGGDTVRNSPSLRSARVVGWSRPALRRKDHAIPKPKEATMHEDDCTALLVAIASAAILCVFFYAVP